jgi:DNA-nicking Smr family endonuclease
MKRPLKAEEVKLWTVVASTVRPAPGKRLPEPSEAEIAPPPAKANAKTGKTPPGPFIKRKAVAAPAPPPAPPAKPKAPPTPAAIEPLRKRRIARERDPIEARLDLHGLDQDRARVALHGFLQRAHEQGFRAVLVITGKGTLGDGVLRRRAPDWLSEPQVRPLIAGVSPAERHHGGEGALYIALKRRKA